MTYTHLMKNLQIALNGEYFDQIKNGTKTEEYRLVTPYWTKRLLNREYDNLILTKGYPSKDDSSRRLQFKYIGFMVKTITHPHFGTEPVVVYAIQIET